MNLDKLNNSNAGIGEHIQLTAQHHKLTAHAADGFAIVLAKVGYGLEVGC